ncbi:LamG domain-containing protein [Nonomuraea spiralis]|uniref:LamG domain-containing protein n=1 Tax=Nonomuraea spiralis TaxID=46182 RepID=UPI00379CEE39
MAAYGFEEGSGTTIIDSSGNGNHGTGWHPEWHDGPFGRALSHRQVTVSDADSLRLTSGMTLEAWVHPSTDPNASAVIISKGDPNGDAYPEYWLAADSGYYSPEWASTQTTVRTEEYPWLAGPGLPVNVWTHLAATYDGNALRIYVNGEQAAEQATAGGPITTGDEPLYLGFGETQDPSWLLDEVRIYNRALSSAEIQADMKTTVTGTAFTDRAPTAPAVSGTGGQGEATLTWSAAADDLGLRGYEIHRSAQADFTPSPATLVTTVNALTYRHQGVAPGAYYYKVAAVDYAGHATSSAAVAVTVNPLTWTLVASYGMNHSSGRDVTDSSGGGHHGTVASPITWVPGKYGNAASFPGYSTSFTIPDWYSLNTTAMTAEFWVRLPAADSKAWVTKSDGTISPPDGYSAFWLQVPAGAYATGDVAVAGTGTSVNSTDTFTTADAWHHVALTYDLKVLRLYVDGTLVDERAPYPQAGSIRASAAPLRLGGAKNGMLDEVRLYSVALSQEQIRYDMLTPVG